MIDAGCVLADRVERRRVVGRPAVVVIGGPVAVGKSTLATQLANHLTVRRAAVEVVSTDGFLFPNAELVRRGLSARKGFPESYDVAALHAFVEAVKSGATDVTAPVYSHETYDIVPDARREIGVVDVVVIEGVNALAATAELGGHLDLSVYIHADEATVETWFIDRFRILCAGAAGGSFYSQFAGLAPDALDEFARSVWETINLPNLRGHIAPSRHLAHVVVEKEANHRIGAICEATPA